MGTDTFTVHIDSLSFGGRGVGKRADGKVVFVPAVIPGEVVRVQKSEEHVSYILAEVEEILEYSPERVEPRCRIFDKCGGCDWQHISYTNQVFWKNRILAGEINKACKTSSHVLDPVCSEMIYGYRGHAIIQCTYDPDFRMGFYQKRSKQIVEFDECPVLNPRITKTLADLREILRQYPLKGLYSLEIHAPQDDVILLARCKGSSHDDYSMAMNRIYNELDVSGVSFMVFGARRTDHILGQRFCQYDISTRHGIVKLSSGFGGFIQANMMINTALVGYVTDLAGESETILDLYSGSGNFSLPISYEANKVVAIERSRRLASQGKINAKKNSIGNVRFISMDARKAVDSIKNEMLSFDTVILDPPRQGAKDIVKVLPGLSPSRIIYISCDPSTLARDIKGLVDHGYSLMHSRVFDMFPQTYHIEAVSYLEL
ncbi:MAG TPA: class I SAM-dependent RNA methyltransferase [Deltaproteobacteria bacterium]|nr:class I SAM-dependent RNA methyltransferase [Deltaproteobacteria bacterium]